MAKPKSKAISKKLYPDCPYAVDRGPADGRLCAGEFLHLRPSPTMCEACGWKNDSSEAAIRLLKDRLEMQLYDQQDPGSSRHEAYCAAREALEALQASH